MTDLLPISDLGAIEKNGAATFGLWMPWVPDADGNRGDGSACREWSCAGAFPYAGSGVGQEVEMYRLGDGSGPANPGN